MAEYPNLILSTNESNCDENDNNKLNANCITFESTVQDTAVCSDLELLNDVQTLTSFNTSNNTSEVFLDRSEIVLQEVITNEINPNFNILDSSSFYSNMETNDIPNENISGNKNLLDLTDAHLNTHGEIFSDFPSNENSNQLKDDEFHDAVQFFKDPSSISFLENAGSSKEMVEIEVGRSSLYVNFDPLHEKFSKQFLHKTNKLDFILETAQETDTIMEKEINIANEVKKDIDVAKKDVIKMPLVDISHRESMGNILISFDSPIAKNQTSTVPESDPGKVYSEDELQQCLKLQELSLHEGFLIRQREMEQENFKRQAEMEQQKNCLSKLCVSFHASLTEISGIAASFSAKLKTLESEKNDLKIENRKLKEDLKVSTCDFQKLESTFSDFHKRYEQSKSMLKAYKDNEDCLKQQVVTIQMDLQEKEKMYQLLQSRTEEMLQKANAELSNAKKASEAQAAVLKAQLKKAELKISSLESDYKQIKIENSKLGGICDDLMAKVSET